MRSKQRAWLVVAAVYLGSVAVALNQSKVPPVMHILMTELKVDMTMGGWLMSAFSITGVILAIPAALVLSRIGPLRAGLLSLGCSVLGSAIGALASDAVTLLFGRMVEGVALGLIAVIAPAVISMWFPPGERSTPMGVWTTWVPVGRFLMYNLAAPLFVIFRWQGVWWFGALVSLAAFAFYAILVRDPAPASASADVPYPQPGDSLARTLLAPVCWILALVFATFNFSYSAYGTWAPLYLSTQLGIPEATSNFVTSLTSISVILSSIFAGWALDRTRNRRALLSAALLAAGILFILSFQLGVPLAAAPYMIVIGIPAGFVPPALFTLASETSSNRNGTGLALGILTIGQNLGMLVGPPVLGAALNNAAWQAGTLPLVTGIGLGLVASLWLQREPARARTDTAPIPLPNSTE